MNQKEQFYDVVHKYINDALWEGSLDMFKRELQIHHLSEIDRKQVLYNNFRGQSLYQQAIQVNNCDIVLFMLSECGADPNLDFHLCGDGTVVSALSLAVWFQSYKVAQVLIDSGADIGHVNNDGIPVFHYTCFRSLVAQSESHLCFPERKKTIDLLVSKGVSPGVKDKAGRTCLMRAVCDVPLFNFLLSLGVDASITDSQSRSALHYAAKHDSLDVVKRLVQLGANCLQQDKKDKTPVTLASQRKSDAVFLYFLQLPCIPLEHKILACDLRVIKVSQDMNNFLEVKDVLRSKFCLLENSSETKKAGAQGPDNPGIFQSIREPCCSEELDSLSDDLYSMCCIGIAIHQRRFGDDVETMLHRVQHLSDMMFAIKHWRKVFCLGVYLYKCYLDCEEGKSNLYSNVLLNLNRTILFMRNEKDIFTDSFSMLRCLRRHCEASSIGSRDTSMSHLIIQCLVKILIILSSELPKTHFNALSEELERIAKVKPRDSRNQGTLQALVLSYLSNESDKASFDCVLDWIHCAGFDMNEFDIYNRSPLYETLNSYCFYRECKLYPDMKEKAEYAIKVLLQHGARGDIPDKNNKTAFSIMRQIGEDVSALKYQNLKDMAARVIAQNNIQYEQHLPKSLHPLVKVYEQCLNVIF